ncbi:MAG TPA: glycosyltransferase [Gemmatimonadaceae bacterium]|nr:glycosyltransferase [Gemmatimonadaceae bacterium]
MTTAVAERVTGAAGRRDADHDAVERALLDVPRAQQGLDIGSQTLPPVQRPAARRAVLDITEFFGETSGGVRTYLFEKARYVDARPHLRHVVVVPGRRDAITETAGVRCYRLRGPRVPTQAPYRFMLATRSSRRIVEHERPDVIEVGSIGLVPWVVRHAARGAAVPLVAFYHSHLPRMIAPRGAQSPVHRRLGESLAWRYLRALDRHFATTIVASDFAARELAAAGIDRTTRVPLGVDLALFHPRRRGSASMARRLAGLSTRPMVLFVGRLARDKEVETLIEGWRLAQPRLDAELVIVGSGPRAAALHARASGLRVRWVPYVANRVRLAHLMAAADVCVAPSSVETFGLSAIEALASGVPVLAADRGGVAELVERSGAGARFEAASPASLAEQLAALFRADLPALGARGRAYAERDHDWTRVLDRLFAVYDGLAGS